MAQTPPIDPGALRTDHGGDPAPVVFALVATADVGGVRVVGHGGDDDSTDRSLQY